MAWHMNDHKKILRNLQEVYTFEEIIHVNTRDTGANHGKYWNVGKEMMKCS